MKRLISAYLLICVFIGASLTGCSPVTGWGGGLVKVKSVKTKKLQSPVYGEQDSAASTAARGANDFAFRLSAELAKNVNDESFVCSPYSVWLPLAALVSATKQQDRDALLTALGASGITERDMNRAALRMLYDLTKLRGKDVAEKYNAYHNPIKIANAIFVGKNMTLRKEFAQTFMDFYSGRMMNVDFASRNAVNAVNQWASENTDGLITDMIKEFDPATIAAIVNAIYFSDRWEREFNPEETAEGVFRSPKGNKTAYYMLREVDNQDYYEDERVQAMPLLFRTGGGMYIVLPKSENAAELLSSMTGEYFDEIQRGSVSAKGKLLLPRFSVESNVGMLKESLTALGVTLFDENSAPLSGLIKEDIPVWLSDALQKAVIKVDEKGTTAAAVTVMRKAGSAIPIPTEPFEMICDRPFVFVLYEPTYDGGNQVLFTGIVNQP